MILLCLNKLLSLRQVMQSFSTRCYSLDFPLSKILCSLPTGHLLHNSRRSRVAHFAHSLSSPNATNTPVALPQIPSISPSIQQTDMFTSLGSCKSRYYILTSAVNLVAGFSHLVQGLLFDIRSQLTHSWQHLWNIHKTYAIIHNQALHFPTMKNICSRRTQKITVLFSVQRKAPHSSRVQVVLQNCY